MDRLMNVVVKFAKKVKEGESEFGPWTLWNFTIVDPDWDGIWFSWFSGGVKPIPAVGMKLDALEYEVVEKDGYTNYNAKKLLTHEDASIPASNPKPVTKPTTGGPKQASGSTNGGQAYINHGEVVCKLMDFALAPDGSGIDRPLYKKLLNAFRYGIRVLTSETPPPAPKAEPEPIEEPPPEEDLPF